MFQLVARCPRCGANKMTFDIVDAIKGEYNFAGLPSAEVFCVCRECKRGVLFVLRLIESNAVNIFQNVGQWFRQAVPMPISHIFEVVNFVSIKDEAACMPPDYVPESIADVFREGASCLAIGCHNAAASMFRLCLDAASRPLLPDQGDKSTTQPTANERNNLGARLRWLFRNGRLPADLEDLATCIREDGNDGAHVGNLTEEDTEDILDFTYELLERLFTEPGRLKDAKSRRVARRKK